jgi:hypothetical protein
VASLQQSTKTNSATKVGVELRSDVPIVAQSDIVEVFSTGKQMQTVSKQQMLPNSRFTSNASPTRANTVNQDRNNIVFDPSSSLASQQTVSVQSTSRQQISAAQHVNNVDQGRNNIVFDSSSSLTPQQPETVQSTPRQQISAAKQVNGHIIADTGTTNTQVRLQ